MKKSVSTVGATLTSLLSKCVHAEPRHQAYLEYCLRVCLCSSGSVLRVLGKNFALTLRLVLSHGSGSGVLQKVSGAYTQMRNSDKVCFSPELFYCFCYLFFSIL